MKTRKFAIITAITALLILSMSTGVLAAESFDMTAQITTTIGELTTQFWAMMGVVAPAICIIVGGKLMLTKGIGWFKSLTGKA